MKQFLDQRVAEISAAITTTIDGSGSIHQSKEQKVLLNGGSQMVCTDSAEPSPQ